MGPPVDGSLIATNMGECLGHISTIVDKSLDCPLATHGLTNARFVIFKFQGSIAGEKNLGREKKSKKKGKK